MCNNTLWYLIKHNKNPSVTKLISQNAGFYIGNDLDFGLYSGENVFYFSR